jgi:hypothetical protein
MTTFLVIVIALLLIAALERTNRRQVPHAPGLHGADAHDDRDWARMKLDLLALAGEAEPFARKPMAVRRPGQMDTPVLRHPTTPVRHHWNTNRRNGPRSA